MHYINCKKYVSMLVKHQGMWTCVIVRRAVLGRAVARTQRQIGGDAARARRSALVRVWVSAEGGALECGRRRGRGAPCDWRARRCPTVARSRAPHPPHFLSRHKGRFKYFGMLFGDISPTNRGGDFSLQHLDECYARRRNLSTATVPPSLINVRLLFATDSVNK